MKNEPINKQKKEYDKFMNEQFRILQGHFSRCMLRCYNKYINLIQDNQKQAKEAFE